MRTSPAHRFQRTGKPVKNKGFSLIEITMVLLILGVAAAAVTLRVEPMLHHAQTEQVVRDIVEFDRLTRTLARRHDQQFRLVLDTSVGELRRLDVTGVESCGRAVRLPDGFAMTKVLLRAQDIGAGTISIPCSRRGFMPTYAVRLDGPGGRRQWILMTALGGQEVMIDDDNDQKLTEILAFTTRRRDTD